MRRSFLSLRRVACAVAIAFAIVSQSAQADLVTFTVNSAQSSMSLNGSVLALNYTPQTAGSLVTSLSGTITADLTAGVLTFSSGSSVVVNVNPNGPFTTAPNPIGTENGNFGVFAAGATPFGDATVNGVYKDLVIDLTSGTAQNGVALGATLKFSAGHLDYGALLNGNPLTGDNAIDGSAANTSSSLVSLNGTTLILPFAFTTTGGNNRIENWTGTISATAVPEPTSLALVALAGIGLSAARRRSAFRNPTC